MTYLLYFEKEVFQFPNKKETSKEIFFFFGSGILQTFKIAFVAFLFFQN